MGDWWVAMIVNRSAGMKQNIEHRTPNIEHRSGMQKMQRNATVENVRSVSFHVERQVGVEVNYC
jgi:hypothetical protein